MKILSASQVKELDNFTISSEPIASIDLMERASKLFTERFCVLYQNNHKVAIVAGTGNNGGDALAICRMLAEMDYNVQLYIVGELEKSTKDFQKNYSRLPSNIVQVKDVLFEAPDVVIDGIFGSGLTRPVELNSIYGKVIQQINSLNVPIVAIDISSGLFADQPTTSIAVKSKWTISFQLPKLAFMMPENYRFVGAWDVLDIGLDPEFIKKSESKFLYLLDDDIRPMLPERQKFDHKGTFGRGLLIAGGLGKMGAAIMAAESYLRSGGSLLSVMAPKIGMDSLYTRLPEAMYLESGENCIDAIETELEHFDAVGIGPGIGTESITLKALSNFLEMIDRPIVLDADALNLVAKDSNLKSLIPPNSILTPHIGEFDRIAGPSKNHFERIEKLTFLASELQSIVVLKGAHTAIGDHTGNVYFNSTGNEGMATGGSGDVLTGLITSFFAQTKHPLKSALLGVYIHGLAGDLAAKDKGKESMIATDIIEYFGAAFSNLKNGLSQ